MDPRFATPAPPGFITELLRCEQARGAPCGEAQAVHAVNDLLTPEVEYGTWQDFVDLVYQVQDAYCLCVATACRLERAGTRTSMVVGEVTHGTLSELPHLRVNGPLIIAGLTRGQGRLWCQLVSHLLYSCALQAAATYVDVLSELEVTVDDESMTNGMVTAMIRDTRRVFSGAMPMSIYSLGSGFVGALLVKNFTLFGATDFPVTDKQFRELLLAFCMGSHARLGSRSLLLALQDDLLRCICAELTTCSVLKTFVFHSHEQWLVA